LADPCRSLGRLHGLVGHGQQLGVEGVQVDLLARAVAERRELLGGVVAAAVGIWPVKGFC